MRTFGTVLLPLLTPFVVYLVWQWAIRRRQEAEAEGRALPRWQEWPWFWLVSSGAVLVALTFITIGLMGIHGTEGEYLPPRYEDGRIVPGRIER